MPVNWDLVREWISPTIALLSLLVAWRASRRAAREAELKAQQAEKRAEESKKYAETLEGSPVPLNSRNTSKEWMSASAQWLRISI